MRTLSLHRSWFQAIGAVALLAVAACAEQGLLYDKPLLSENNIDLSPYVGVYTGPSPTSDTRSAYFQLWPAHPTKGHHVLEYFEDADGPTSNGATITPLFAQRQPDGATLIQVQPGDFYWLDIVTIAKDGIAWSPLIDDSEKIKHLKQRFGLQDDEDNPVEPLPPQAVAGYLAAAKSEGPPLQFTRIDKGNARWPAFLEARNRAREEERYSIDAYANEMILAGQQQFLKPDRINGIMALSDFGDPWAVYMMARYHYNGWFVEKDAGRASVLIQRALQGGHKQALNLVGVMAANDGTPDLVSARRYYEQAAEAGETVSLTNLALLDLKSEDKVARFQAISRLQAAAARGDPRATEELGLLYYNGETLAQDDAEARRLFEIAANRSFPHAAFILGYLRAAGRGGDVDFEGAVAAYEKAVELGSTGAKLNLGLLYWEGSGTEKNPVAAVALFQEAAAAGDIGAVMMLAQALETGQGIAQNDAEAARQYALCADKGDAYCSWRLGEMTLEGRGVKRDPARATGFLEAAAKGGEKRAEATLARLSGAQAPAAGRVESGAPTVIDYALFMRPQYMSALAAGQGLVVNDDVMAYLNGLLELYLPNCAWPGSNDELTSVVQFYQATTQRMLTNSRSLQVVGNAVAFANAATDGKADIKRFAELYGCDRNPFADKLASGVLATVTVQSASGGPSPFVESCSRTRLNEQQCTCLAELGRGAYPNIDQTHYNRHDTIKSIVNQNPFLGLQIGLQCGISDY